MSEFQVFIEYTWPFFVFGLIIRIVCWSLGEGVAWLHVSLGDKKE